MPSLLERLDHFVVPVDDVLAAEAFYTDVLGGRIATFRDGTPMRRGLSVDQFRAGFRPHTFFELAGKRIGVYLQCDVREKPASAYGAPTYSFETTPAFLDELARRMAASGVPCEGPRDDDQVTAPSLFFNDLAGNHYHVFAPNRRNDNGAYGDSLHAVGYLRVEAPNLETSMQFYAEVLGVEVQGIGRNARLPAREATLVLPSGQLLLLAEVPWSPKGVESGWDARGVHLAFSVRPERWPEVLGQLAKAGIAHGDTAPEGRRQAGARDTYIADPAGNRIQLVGDG